MRDPSWVTELGALQHISTITVSTALPCACTQRSTLYLRFQQLSVPDLSAVVWSEISPRPKSSPAATETPGRSQGLRQPPGCRRGQRLSRSPR